MLVAQITFEQFKEIIINARRRGARVVKISGVLINICHPNYILFTSDKIYHGHKCQNCDRKIVKAGIFVSKNTPVVKGYFHLFSSDDIVFTKDHIIPRSHGGQNCLDNYQTMCYNCNQQKSSYLSADDLSKAAELYSFNEACQKMISNPGIKFRPTNSQIIVWYNSDTASFWSTANSNFIVSPLSKEINQFSLKMKNSMWLEDGPNV
jgi:hypothetical protein